MSGPSPDDLRTIPLFRGFADDERAEIAALFSRAEPRDGGELFAVDEPARGFFLLSAGEVTLDRPGDDVYRLRPPALIGELGGLAGLGRNCRAVASADAEVWLLESKTVQQFFAQNQELGVRFLVNLLEVVADKIHRDQRRLEDMRGNLVRTQKELKRLRELVLDSPETPVSAPVHDALDALIVHNRRVNYRVEPPPALASRLRVEGGHAPVLEWSRTHVSATWPEGAPVPAAGDWVSGVAELGGAEIPVSGKVIRAHDRRLTIELDLLIDEYVAILEGYLTRVQLLDILV
ncbi:MAG: cyclic nucleotide-binding domain-containing protein [Kofleriaceae bacterium]|nr:cyclic nucleotide-binding domain-containing protein [Myxococcales bacterium]MCB9563275.1 cyclic nucleotide-binding domain-containing protein [Kofleriaceae bacterium]